MRTRSDTFLGSLALCAVLAAPGLAQAAAISGQGTWETTLQARDLDGNLATVEAYYDTDLGITWLADANYAATHQLYPLYPTGFMIPAAAEGFAATLNVNGVTGWRLPTTGGGACTFAYSGTDCGYNVATAGNELAHMFSVTLGDLAYCSPSATCPQAGSGLNNTGPFANLQAGPYWASIWPLNNNYRYALNFGTGYQTILFRDDGGYAWAVHSGDIGTATVVPLPAAAMLFSPALGLLVAMRRRRPGTET